MREPLFGVTAGEPHRCCKLDDIGREPFLPAAQLKGMFDLLTSHRGGKLNLDLTDVDGEFYEEL